MDIWDLIFVKLTRLFRELGYSSGILYLADRVVSSIFFKKVRIIRYYIYFQPLLTASLLPAGRAKNVMIAEVYVNNINELGFPRSDKTIKKRFLSGARCFAAFQRDRMTGYAWLAFQNYEEDEVRCDYVFGDQLVWDYDVYIEPKYRIGFVFAKLWEHINQFMSENGIAGSVSRISAENIVSIKSHEKLGGKRLGSQVFIKIGSIEIMVSSVRPRVYLSLSNLKRPKVFIKVPDKRN